MRGNLVKPKRVTTSIKCDKDLWKQFKIRCIELDRPMNECLEEALIDEVNRRRIKRGEPPLLSNRSINEK